MVNNPPIHKEWLIYASWKTVFLITNISASVFVSESVHFWEYWFSNVYLLSRPHIPKQEDHTKLATPPSLFIDFSFYLFQNTKKTELL